MASAGPQRFPKDKLWSLLSHAINVLDGPGGQEAAAEFIRKNRSDWPGFLNSPELNAHAIQAGLCTSEQPLVTVATEDRGQRTTLLSPSGMEIAWTTWERVLGPQNIIDALKDWLDIRAAQLVAQADIPLGNKGSDQPATAAPASEDPVSNEPTPKANPPIAPLPESDDAGAVAAYVSVVELATKHGVDSESLRKRLVRFHKKNDNAYIEVAEPLPNRPRYLYAEQAVAHIIEALKSGRTPTSGQRPAKNKFA